MLKPHSMTALALGISLLAMGIDARAAQPPLTTPDFNGAWRLNEQTSDSPDQITAKLRAEIRREKPPAVVAPASASTSGGAAQASTGSGTHGGGRGMGGGSGGGGMGGGGHGHGGHQQANTSSDTSTTASDALNPPPLIDNDTMLIVQQDQKTLQAQLENGEQLLVRLDGNNRQTLNGSAFTQMQATDNGMQVSMTFTNGTKLDEVWTRSADGHTLHVTEEWQPPFLQHPVSFHRDYDRLDQ